jgi:hypothetical protein
MEMKAKDWDPKEILKDTKPASEMDELIFRAVLIILSPILIPIIILFWFICDRWEGFYHFFRWQ